jgi:hypothetical protein
MRTTSGPEIIATTIGTTITSTALHPIRHRLSVVAIYLGLLNSLALALPNRRTVKVLLSVGEPQTDAFYMALETN